MFWNIYEEEIEDEFGEETFVVDDPRGLSYIFNDMIQELKEYEQENKDSFIKLNQKVNRIDYAGNKVIVSVTD